MARFAGGQYTSIRLQMEGIDHLVVSTILSPSIVPSKSIISSKSTKNQSKSKMEDFDHLVSTDDIIKFAFFLIGCKAEVFVR